MILSGKNSLNDNFRCCLNIIILIFKKNDHLWNQLKTWRIIYLKMWCRCILLKYSIQYVSWWKKVYHIMQVKQAEIVCAWYHGNREPSSNAYNLKTTVYREVQLSIQGSVKQLKMDFLNNTKLCTSLYFSFSVIADVFWQRKRKMSKTSCWNLR